MSTLRLGIISDTHGLLRPEVFRAFAGVDAILHAGDLGGADLFVELEAIAPVTCVWGNTDGPEVRARVPEIAQLEMGGLQVVVVHGQQFGSPTPRVVVKAYPGADLVVFGHSHRPLIERVEGTLAINPGSAGPRRFRDPVTVAVAEVEGGAVTARLIPLLEDSTSG